MQNCIVKFERECISRGEQKFTKKTENSTKFIEKSLNLSKPEKGNSSDVRGWEQPITADDTENSPKDAFAETQHRVACDWTRGKLFAASDESEGGDSWGIKFFVLVCLFISTLILALLPRDLKPHWLPVLIYII